MTFNKISKKGFTLMELLVTVILVAILATYAVYYYTDIMREGEVNAAKGKLAALGGAVARYVLEKGTITLQNEVTIGETNLTTLSTCNPAATEDIDKVLNVFRCGYAEKSLGIDDHFKFVFSPGRPCGSDLDVTTVYMEPQESEHSDIYPECAYFDPDLDKVIVVGA